LSPAQRGFDYKVVWRPEGVYADSWEPEANLSSAAEVIQAYEESLPAPSQDSGQVRRSSRLQGVYVYSDFAMPLFDDDPVSRSQALSSPFAEQWIEAEIDELQSIQEMGVWTLVDLKPGMHVLGSRFVYKTKRNPDGTVQKHKVRLVAQGFRQKEGLDYQDVFATTVAWQSIRIVLWLATFYRFFLAKVDIKTFFLYTKTPPQINIINIPHTSSINPTSS
jgi:hypothetical protein